MILAAVVWLLHTQCVGAAEKPPLPIWNGPQSWADIKTSDKWHSYLSDDFSELILVAKQEDGEFVVHRFSLGKRLDPHIEVEVSFTPSQRYRYSYSISNGVSAREPILQFNLVVPTDFDNDVVTTDGQEGGEQWNGLVGPLSFARQCEVREESPGRLIAWVGTHELTYAIPPGGKRGGFGIDTKLRPGFTTAYLGGPFLAIPESLAGSAEGLEIVSNSAWSMVHTPTIGPMFGQKSSCKKVLDNYRSGISRVLEEKQSVADEVLFGDVLKLINSSGTCAEVRNHLPDASEGASSFAGTVLSALRMALSSQP